jgi:hypothetical protein
MAVAALRAVPAWHQIVMRTLIDPIVRGAIEVGQVPPPEADIADEFEMSTGVATFEGLPASSGIPARSVRDCVRERAPVLWLVLTGATCASSIRSCVADAASAGATC